MLVSCVSKDHISYVKDLLKSYPFVYRERLHLSPSFSFGCEVEINGLSIRDAKSILYDTDLFQYKVNPEVTASSEVVTPILRDNLTSWREIASLLRLLVQGNATVSDNTAGHIHVGTHMIDTPKKLKCLLKVLAIFHPILFRFGYGYTDTHRCFMTCNNPFEHNYAAVNDFDAIDTFLNTHFPDLDTFISSFNDFFQEKDEKNSNAFNFMPFDAYHLRDLKDEEPSSLNHMEFRHPNGSLDPKIWQNNVMLVGTIVDKIGTEQVDFDAIDKLYSKYHKTHWMAIKTYINDPQRYEEYLQGINSFQYELACQFATLFFPDEEDLAYFWRGYAKVYQESDVMKLDLIHKAK